MSARSRAHPWWQDADPDVAGVRRDERFRALTREMSARGAQHPFFSVPMANGDPVVVSLPLPVRPAWCGRIVGLA